MNKLMKAIYILFTLSILLTVSSNVRAEVTNKYCPVTTNELAEEKFSLEYEGETIYLCCNGCKKDFLADPEKYMAKLATMKTESETDAHDSSNTHGTTAQSVDVSSTKPIEGGHGEEPAHDHETDHEQTSSLLTFIGKFHPLVIHFPIALVFTALLFTGLAMLLKVEIFDTLSIYLIYFAALSALLAVILGLIAGYNASYPSFLISSFELHRILGISSSLVTFITAYIGYRQLSQNPSGGVMLYRLVLLVNAILVGVTGHLGATLVFGLDYFNF